MHGLSTTSIRLVTGISRLSTRKKDADDYHATVKVDVSKGIHTAHSKSLTVAEAADDWIKYVELEKRERSTLDQYRNHVKNHINPRLGR